MRGVTVWVVVCIDDEGEEVTHIFSSTEHAESFCEKDSRAHVVYDYVVDFPERHEGIAQ